MSLMNHAQLLFFPLPDDTKNGLIEWNNYTLQNPIYENEKARVLSVESQAKKKTKNCVAFMR